MQIKLSPETTIPLTAYSFQVCGTVLLAYPRSSKSLMDATKRGLHFHAGPIRFTPEEAARDMRRLNIAIAQAIKAGLDLAEPNWELDV